MTTSEKGKSVSWWIFDGSLLLLLCGGLWAVSIFDLAPAVALITPDPTDEQEPAPPPLPPDIVPPAEPIDPEPRIAVAFSPTYLAQFGVVTTSGNPDDDNDNNLKLTYEADGRTNDTRVSVDGQTPEYGSVVGQVVAALNSPVPGQFESSWKFRDVTFKQVVDIVPGDISRRRDTARIKMTATNDGNSEHQVGVRFMIDTFIGGNDGVPFIVSGKQSLIQEAITFEKNNIPDFIRALQNASLSQPGVIADLGLRCADVEAPDEVVLSHWPGHEPAWNYNRVTRLGGDSAAGLYYLSKALKPGETRTMGFTYGLGSISSTKSQNARLSLTAGGPFAAGGSFWMVALVQSPKPDSSVQIVLPEGLTLAAGHTASKPVTSTGKISQISWLVAAESSAIGEREILVKLQPDGVSEKQKLVIGPPAAKLTLKAPATAILGKPFWVSALIRNSQLSQTVELTIPEGLTFAKGHSAKQTITEGKPFLQMNWLLRSTSQKPGSQQLQVRLEPNGDVANGSVEMQLGNIVQ